MSYRRIEQSRETRLWLGQIIIPAVTSIILLAANPDVRWWIREKCNHVKVVAKNKFSKKERG